MLRINTVLTLEEQVYRHRTTTFIDQTGGAIAFFKRGGKCARNHPEVNSYTIRAYDALILDGASLIRFCDHCTPAADVIAEFSDAPGMITLAFYNRDTKSSSFLTTDLNPHPSRGDQAICQPRTHRFLPHHPQLSRDEVLTKLRDFVKTCRDFEVNRIRAACFAPRLGIILIRGTQQSTQTATVHYWLGQMEEFASISQADLLEEGHRELTPEQWPAFSAFENGQGEWYLNGERAEEIRWEEI